MYIPEYIQKMKRKKNSASLSAACTMLGRADSMLTFCTKNDTDIAVVSVHGREESVILDRAIKAWRIQGLNPYNLRGDCRTWRKQSLRFSLPRENLIVLIGTLVQIIKEEAT